MTSRMPAITFLGTIALAFVASGCFHTRKRTEDLAIPALVWSRGNGLCSRIVAVDGERTVWIDQGCETPVDLDEGRTISAAQMDDLWTKFAALPFDQSAGDCGANMTHYFARRAPPEPSMGAGACGGGMYDDFSTLPAAFLPLAEAMRALE